MPKLKKRSTANHTAKMREEMIKRRNKLGHAKLIPWFSCHCSYKLMSEEGIFLFYFFIAPKSDEEAFSYCSKPQKVMGGDCLFLFD